MREEREGTGYPSKDRPHYKYYRKFPVREININQTIYEMVFSSNRNYMDTVALEYMGVNWTYNKLKNKTDQTVDAFAKAGLRMRMWF